jgi:hypothetical protein
MWKGIWRQTWQPMWQTWTVDKPAALGDWLWQILVVEFAALLDRLTLRKLIALIPVVIVIGAYWHRIPLPPELMLVGDVLAYIDIFSMIFLIGFFTRVATVVAVVSQAIDFVRRMLRRMPTALRGFDNRHRRAKDTTRRKRFTRASADDEDAAVMAGLAWAWSERSGGEERDVPSIAAARPAHRHRRPGAEPDRSRKSRSGYAGASWRDPSRPAGIDETRYPSGNSRHRTARCLPHRPPRRPNRVSSSGSTKPNRYRASRGLLQRNASQRCLRNKLPHCETVGRCCRSAQPARASVTEQ